LDLTRLALGSNVQEEGGRRVKERKKRGQGTLLSLPKLNEKKKIWG